MQHNIQEDFTVHQDHRANLKSSTIVPTFVNIISQHKLITFMHLLVNALSRTKLTSSSLLLLDEPAHHEDAIDLLTHIFSAT